MGANLMYSPLESVFESTMEREGKNLTTYSSGTEFRAFFRIKNDNENQKETIIIYYDVSAPVHSGTLVTIENEVFLALNKETVENDVYYKSTLIKCNGIYNENNRMIYGIPFYCANMKSSVSIENSVISMLNGNIELLMEENSLTKQIEINATFHEFNRTFKVANKYTIDGITHLIAEVETDQKPKIVYSIKIDGVPSAYVEPDSTIQLSATPYINGKITTGATFNWISSENLIATVDNTGKITCISEGTVKITVTWIEKDISETIYIIVANVDTPIASTYNCAISGNTDLRNRYKRIYTVTFTNQAGNTVDWNEVNYQWNIIADFHVTQTITHNKITLSVNDDDLILSTFLLQVLIDEEVKAEMKITIVE